MSLENILKRRALRLKAELSEGKAAKPGILSVIYPATDHGRNMPATVKTPSSIPSPNDGSSAVTDDQPEKKQKQKDGPGTSKAPELPGVDQSSSVSDAHKKAAFELGYFGEGRSERFISRCVELITGVSKVEQRATEPTEVPPGPVVAPGKTKLMDVVSKFKKDKPAPGHD